MVTTAPRGTTPARALTKPMGGCELEGHDWVGISNLGEASCTPVEVTSILATGIVLPALPSSLAACKRHHSSLRHKSLRLVKIKLSTSASLSGPLAAFGLASSPLKRCEPQTSPPAPKNLRHHLFPATSSMPWALTVRRLCIPSLRKDGASGHLGLCAHHR